MIVRLLAMCAIAASAACSRDAVNARVRAMLERELGAAISTCQVKNAPNPFGDGIILFCENSSAVAAHWIYTEGVVYTVNDRARSLTPRVKSVLDADPDQFQRMGLRHGNIEQQITEAISR